MQEHGVSLTTLAYKDGVLAADSRVTQGDRIVPGNYCKIERLPDGSLLGGSGSVALLKKLRHYLISNRGPLPTWEDHENTEALRVFSNGAVWSYAGDGVWLEHKGPYCASGSGADYAYGAMAAGACAKTAVKIAKEFDTGSGGPVRTLKL